MELNNQLKMVAQVMDLDLNPYAVDLLNENPNDKRIGSYYIFEYLYNDPSTLPSGVSLGDPLDLYDRDEEAGFSFLIGY